MIQKTFKYTDFNGNVQEETFYFNISKAEAIEMEVSEKEGLSTALQKIVDSKDNKQILATFKDVLMRAVGEKSEDGKRFIKNDDIRDAFIQSPAYDELFMELMTDAGAGAEFIQAVLPQDLDLTNIKGATRKPKAPSDRKPKAPKTTNA